MARRGDFVAASFSKADGSFEIPGLSPGPAVLNVTARDYLSVGKKLELKNGDNFVEVRLKPTESVEIISKNQEGKLIPDSAAHPSEAFRRGLGETGEVVTSWHVEKPAPGKIRIRIPQGWKAVELEVSARGYLTGRPGHSA